MGEPKCPTNLCKQRQGYRLKTVKDSRHKTTTEWSEAVCDINVMVELTLLMGKLQGIT